MSRLNYFNTLTQAQKLNQLARRRCPRHTPPLLAALLASRPATADATATTRGLAAAAAALGSSVRPTAAADLAAPRR